MQTVIVFRGIAIPVDVTVIFKPLINVTEFHVHCKDTYECSDGINRNFTGFGYSLQQALIQASNKMYEHSPVAVRNH